MAVEAKIAGLFLLRKLKKDLQGLLDGVPIKKIRSDVIPEFVNILDRHAKDKAYDISSTGALASGVFVQRGGAGYKGLEAVSISVRGSAGAYARILNTGGTIRAKGKYLTVPMGLNLRSAGRGWVKWRGMREFPDSTKGEGTFVHPKYKPTVIAGDTNYKTGLQITTYARKKVMWRLPLGEEIVFTRKSRKTGSQVQSKPRTRMKWGIHPIFLLASRVVYNQTGKGWATQAKDNALQELRPWLENYLRENNFVGKG